MTRSRRWPRTSSRGRSRTASAPRGADGRRSAAGPRPDADRTAAAQLFTDPAQAAIPTVQVIDAYDLSDLLNNAAMPTSCLIAAVVNTDGTVAFALPRAEVGQGITTAVAMTIADEMDVPLQNVNVTLADARPELIFNQFTGGSNTMLLREIYDYETFNTGSVRNIYRPNVTTATELMVDQVAGALGQHQCTFRRSFVRDQRLLAVLDKVAQTGNWGRAMAPGTRRGSRSAGSTRAASPVWSRSTARATVNRKVDNGFTGPRVTKVSYAVDAGLPINPLGLQAQMMATSTATRFIPARSRPPSEDDLDGIRNVCRCGTYPRIRDAITAAAAGM